MVDDISGKKVPFFPPIFHVDIWESTHFPY